MSAARNLLALAIGTVCLCEVRGAEAAAIPVFSYDADTGVLRMDAGLDAGVTVVSWLVDGPQAQQILVFQDGTSSQGNDWVQGYFDGKEQWIAIAGNGVNGTWDVARYAAGLDLGAFGQVEFGLRYTDGSGETGFAQVVAPAPIEGDLDDDGFVGIADLNIVLGNWNLSVPPNDVRADPSGDGFVGIDDLNRVLGNWNAGTPPVARLEVPEPTIVWACLGALLIRRTSRVS